MNRIEIKNDLIFLDIGTHNGHTLQEVVKPEYKFKKIFGFEPMPVQFEAASNTFKDVEHLVMLNFGLSNKTEKVNIYGSNNNLGSSMFISKDDVEKDVVTLCDVVESSEFFKNNLSTEDTIIVKLNAEGAEIPILNNLIDSGEIWKISNIMIDFDIRKVAGMQHEEGLLMNRLREINFKKYCLVDEVMIGSSHQNRIRNWLTKIGVI